MYSWVIDTCYSECGFTKFYVLLIDEPCSGPYYLWVTPRYIHMYKFGGTNINPNTRRESSNKSHQLTNVSLANEFNLYNITEEQENLAYDYLGRYVCHYDGA